MSPQTRLVAACLVVLFGVGTGAVWQPRPAAAQETIRELSWHLDAMHVEEAHRIATGDGVTVAVVDTGVDSSHPDLEGQVLDGGAVGDSGTGGQTAGEGDKDGHGTGMASLIAGRGGRGPNSVLGVAPRAKILPVKIKQNSDGAFRPEDVYQGVRWAIDHGAEVVNISLGGERSVDAPWKKQLVDYAISKDVVLIAAAGNTGAGDKKVAEPASIPGVVAVSGLIRDGTFWKGSAKGPEVVVAAPAKGLPHAVPTSVSDSGFALADGTSGATALVSGVAALIREAFPDASANDVVNRLIRTAEDRGDDGRDEEYGYGAVDARAALEAEVPGVKHHPLVSPEAAKSDEKAAARAAARGTNDRALIVVGVFVGSVLVLLVGAYLIYLARRSRRVVVAGVGPGYPAMPVTWGAPPYGAPPAGPGAQPGFGAQPPGWLPGWPPPAPYQPAWQSPGWPAANPQPQYPGAQQSGPLPPGQAPPGQVRPPGPDQPGVGWGMPPGSGYPPPPAPQQPGPYAAAPGWPPTHAVAGSRDSTPPGSGSASGESGKSAPGAGVNAVTQAMPIVAPASSVAVPHTGAGDAANPAAPPPPVDPWAQRPPS